MGMDVRISHPGNQVRPKTPGFPFLKGKEGESLGGPVRKDKLTIHFPELWPGHVCYGICEAYCPQGSLWKGRG